MTPHTPLEYLGLAFLAYLTGMGVWYGVLRFVLWLCIRTVRVHKIDGLVNSALRASARQKAVEPFRR